MSGKGKRWISAEVDGRLVAQLEREAQARGISRSEALRRALQEWTREAMEEDEERLTRSQADHRQVMNRLDFIVGMIRKQERSVAPAVAPVVGRSSGTERVGGLAGGREGGLENEDADPRRGERSALDEARKRARRRME